MLWWNSPLSWGIAADEKTKTLAKFTWRSSFSNLSVTSFNASLPWRESIEWVFFFTKIFLSNINYQNLLQQGATKFLWCTKNSATSVFFLSILKFIRSNFGSSLFVIAVLHYFLSGIPLAVRLADRPLGLPVGRHCWNGHGEDDHLVSTETQGLQVAPTRITRHVR